MLRLVCCHHLRGVVSMSRKTRNPRIAFVPSDRVRSVLERLSAVSGQSMASIAAGLLDEAAPVLDDQLRAFEQINARPDKAREVLDGFIAKQRAVIDQAVLDLDAPGHRRKHHRERERDARATR